MKLLINVTHDNGMRNQWQLYKRLKNYSQHIGMCGKPKFGSDSVHLKT